jgi:hypothetical protein
MNRLKSMTMAINNLVTMEIVLSRSIDLPNREINNE